MTITVCDLEVPMCWLGYRKASTSWWEIILFWRFLQHLSKTLELITLFIYLIFDRTGRAVKWFHDNGRGGVVELQAWPIFTRPGFQDLLNLGERRKAIGPSESHSAWRGRGGFSVLGLPSFITFFLSLGWINCTAARLEWQCCVRGRGFLKLSNMAQTCEWLRTLSLSPKEGSER